MRTGRGNGARSGPGHLIGGAFLTANDSRRVACPRCEVKAVARCTNRDGTYSAQSHQERRAAFKASRS